MDDLVTDAMVESAARATYEARGLTCWDEEGPAYLNWYREDARAALEAAAPTIAATALRDAADAYASGRLTGAFLSRDDYARAWLRARADQSEKEG